MGDRALLVELGDEISPSINRKVRELFLKLDRESVHGIKELVPAYRSLMIVYDPLAILLTALKEVVTRLHGETHGPPIPEPKKLDVPVVYGGRFGPDLQWVADFHGISPEEVVRYHVQPVYQVYMIGFTPGFPYLGEVPDAIATPRRETPRTVVPQGSVAIAQRQTGIYPVQSPGGWQILGWTPLRFFDAENWPPTPLEIGDRVKFFPIREKEIPDWQS
ncbi:MAG: 5-oxoprolinase subunit PxpB [Deltaproteobacteria bacterium]|nr:5-oxoprolinase subunit PxpB [Deltaproteobacteria bacterium]